MILLYGYSFRCGSQQVLANMHDIELRPDDIPIDDDGDPLWEPVPQPLNDDEAFSAILGGGAGNH